MNSAGAEAAHELTFARNLGPRGSRAPVGDDDPAGDPGDDARAILAGLPQWWAAAAKTAGLSGRWLELDAALDGPAPIPDVAHPTDLLGATAYEVGARYAAALGRGVRARHGRHYTPALLAETLWSLAIKATGQRLPNLPLPGLVRDPACGAGALLLPALRQHLRAAVDADPRVTLAGIPRLIEGFDTDPSAVWLTNVVLGAELLPLLAAVPEARRRPLPLLARVSDGLRVPDNPARVVLMNPPYGRVRLHATERERWSRYLYGHANLYCLFVAAGLESLDAGGVLAALIPTSFLAGRYFASLRDAVGEEAPLRDVTFVEQRGGVFADVLQETCLAVFACGRGRRTAVSSLNGTVSAVAKVRSPRGSHPWILPRRADDAHVAAAAAGMPLTLASAGWQASTGPLVWNRRRSDLGVTPGAGKAAVIWAADLDGGVLHQDPSRDALRWLTLRESDVGPMILESPCVLVQRTTAPEQARRVVCVELDANSLREWGARVVVENHVNVLRPSTPAPLLSRSTLAAVFATKAIDRLARCISGSVAISAYEIESLPLPDASTLAAWEPLRGDALERAVSAAYTPVS